MQHKLLAMTIGLAMTTCAYAAQGDWLVRGRIIEVAPQVSTSGTLSTLDISVDKQVVPEFDFTYMFTDHIGTELILGTARHEVSAGGQGLGKVSHLPPTLTLQYHFTPEATIRPYAGVGINYTRFYSVGLSAGSTALNIDKNSVGGSLQLGTDIAINKDWFFNVDLKKLYIKTDVKTANGGTDLGTLKINPLVFGVGIGTHF